MFICRTRRRRCSVGAAVDRFQLVLRLSDSDRMNASGLLHIIFPRGSSGLSSLLRLAAAWGSSESNTDRRAGSLSGWHSISSAEAGSSSTNCDRACRRDVIPRGFNSLVGSIISYNDTIICYSSSAADPFLRRVGRLQLLSMSRRSDLTRFKLENCFPLKLLTLFSFLPLLSRENSSADV